MVNKLIGTTAIVSIIVALLLLTTTAIATSIPDCSEWDRPSVPLKKPVVRDAASHDYEGHLRIYVVEPISRYTDRNGDNYEYGFLDFAYNSSITIAYQDTFTQTIDWCGICNGFAGITEFNIMAQAAVFNDEPHTSHSYPPSWYEFTAHWAEASAIAIPGVPGSDDASGDYTHTVFVEEATWNT